MASVNIKTNIGEVTKAVREKLLKLSDKEFLLRPISFDVIDLMTKRIHIDGKDAGDQPIGVYSKSYLKLRQEKFSRKSDAKIIVSLTRQLENDWSVIATEKGYGVGFTNLFNLQKARWVEASKAKEIFSLSSSEQEYVSERIGELITEAFQ